MLHIVNAQNLIDVESETLYSFREGIPVGEYPQVHDFFEFTLVTEGAFLTILDGKSYSVARGTLIAIFPGVNHAKYALPETSSTHINLAMLQSTINDLFKYLYNKCPEDVLESKTVIIQLTNNQLSYIQAEMDYLSLFPSSEKSDKCSQLRRLLVYLIYDIIVPMYRKQKSKMIIPHWMQKLIDEMNTSDNLYEGLAYMVKSSHKTEEHICREFKKYLGVTPNAFINTRKMNYAANMLQYSNREIVEICNDLGFCSLSHFYKLFKQSFGLTPRKFRLSKVKVQEPDQMAYV